MNHWNKECEIRADADYRHTYIYPVLDIVCILRIANMATVRKFEAISHKCNVSEILN